VATRISQLRRSRHHVFDIIEQQQHLPIMENEREAVGGRLFIQLEKAKGLGNGRHDKPWVPNGRERDKPDVVRMVMGEAGGNLESEPGLADAPWAGQGQQTEFIAQQKLADNRHLPLASDKWCERGGKVDDVPVRLSNSHDADASV
jgi:hypothetical protein